MKVSKAIIPAAGLGTRMLPATRTLPKELLPVGGKPMIQDSLEELAEAGFREVAIVVSPGKREAFQRYLTRDDRYAHQPDVRRLNEVIDALDIQFVIQETPLGLADAVSLCRSFVGDEPYALLLPDNVFFGDTGAMSQMLRAFEADERNVVGMISVNRATAGYFGNCGLVEGEPVDDGRVLRLTKLHGKRKGSFDLRGQKEAVRTTGKFILYPEFLDLLQEMRETIEGEIDDVPVMQELVRRDRVLGVRLEGTLFDVGNWAGFAAANHHWGALQGLWKSHF